MKVVGSANVVASGAVLPVRTVREGITDDAILRNFLNRNPVEQPLAYFCQVSHEQAYTLPIFYYLQQAGHSRKTAITQLKLHKSAKTQSRNELVNLLTGKRTLFAKLGGHRSATFNQIVNTPTLDVTDLRQAKTICSALTGMTEADAGAFDHFHSLLSQCLKFWDANPGDRDLLARIRRAASRLDEVEYGPKVPHDGGIV